MNGLGWLCAYLAVFFALLAGWFGVRLWQRSGESERQAMYFGQCSECGDMTHLDWQTDMCACCRFVTVESPEYLMKLEAEMYADTSWRQA